MSSKFVAAVAANHRRRRHTITMRTITKSVLGSPGRSGMSAAALVTLASAIAALALVVLTLSATAAQSTERHNGNAVELSGKTWLEIDKDTAAALSDAGVRSVLTAKVAGTGQRIALLRLGAPEDVKVGSERIMLKGVDAKLTSQAAKALNEAFDTDLFEGGLLIGEATVNAEIGDADNGKDHDDKDDARNDD
jgi:hypothetical protein